MGSGPSWIGIGAQRSGTTWFTDLLLQHPDMTLARAKQKELHILYRGLTEAVDIDEYRGAFDTSGIAGEWTPFYLRALWVPPIALRVTEPNVPFLVLLRDPVERFASAMRLEAGRQTIADPQVAVRMLGADAQWAGMYATQLEAWATAVGRRRLLVMQYERVCQDPQTWVNRVWARLGLGSVPLSNVEAPSRTSTDAGWDWPEGLHAALRAAYLPEVKRLRRWGIRPRLWPNFAG